MATSAASTPVICCGVPFDRGESFGWQAREQALHLSAEKWKTKEMEWREKEYKCMIMESSVQDNTAHGMLNPITMDDDVLVGIWRQRFGHSAWHVLHTFVAHVSEKPSAAERHRIERFIDEFFELYPDKEWTVQIKQFMMRPWIGKVSSPPLPLKC